ncbi:MAG TPA: TonB-dependent receptor [Steroidobacteraceae bacterium]
MSKSTATRITSLRKRAPSALASAVAIALYGGAGAVHAQQTTLEPVLVTGIRASLAQSIDRKRESATVVEVITAEDVGKFPDKNLAESLQRVPGVVINKEFGEGERVSLRGTAPNLTRTLLNGHGLATADWFILDQLNTTRSFNYLMLPSDIIGSVEVHKSSQADFEEGGIGGTINVITRNPLDLESMSFYGSAQVAYTDLADETTPQANLLFSWKNDAENVGLLLAGVYQDRKIRRDGVEVLGYFPVDIDPTAAVNEVLAPALIGSALFQQERKRTGGNIGIQFRPNDRLDLNLTALYSKFDADNINENFLTWGTRAIGNGGTLTNVTVVGDTAVAGRMASAGDGTSDFGAVYDAINRFATAQTSDISLDTVVHDVGDWTLHFKLGYTDASGDTDAQPFVEFGAPAAFTYDLRGHTPSVQFENVDPTDPADMQFIFSSLHQILNDDSETYFYADASRPIDFGAFNGLKLGAKATDHDRDLVFNATTYGGFHVPINTTPSSTFAGPLTPGDFLDGISSPGTLDEYWQINRGATSDFLFANFAAGPGRVPYPQQNFSVSEKAYAGYIMGDIESGKWSGNFGVRIVRTEQTSRGNVVSPNGSISNPFGNYDPISVDRDYTEVLPSLNLSYDLTDETKLRFTAARVMTRPDFTDIAPRASLNPGALTGTAGNPDLDPYLANQADLAIEWYPDSNSIFALGLYYKDIESFITDNPVTLIFPVQSATSPNAACTQTGPNSFDCPFLINQRANGGGGRIYGAELALTKPIAGGFGVQANYTYSNAEADNGDPIPGNSENAFNLAAYFENERISARLAYTYRDEFFVTFDRSTQLNQDDLKSLDASVSVNITDKFALTFDGVNLTNEEIVQFASDSFRPRAVYDNGRIYFAGARFKF